ncbi:MAG: type II toxin-antitoxin system VapB family antitoxin [Gammaproteobacteria bacterium]|nr:type II toxin-antitoxin system VapB family antitoxin [Gammaproteobacteria bacterium]MDE0246941.1 type II toxin-antitoxin system VapB family antitoxin [Gammaproteobacteria bacterium]
MRTTIDIPEEELEDAIRFTNARSKREAVVKAIADFNRRMRMAELVRHAGTCEELMTVEELRVARHRGSAGP